MQYLVLEIWIYLFFQINSYFTTKHTHICVSVYKNMYVKKLLMAVFIME